MAQMIFDEKTLFDSSIFKYENRLHSSYNKYMENGALICTYYNLDDNASTVDRGDQSIDELFGNHAPLRYNKILDFPLYGMKQAAPENNEEINGVNDISLEGDLIVQPSTIVPHQYDFFIINHLSMDAIFMVTAVTYDPMKQDGFYKISYRLYGNERYKIEDIDSRCINTYHTDLNAIGTSRDPIILDDDFKRRNEIDLIINQMIELYRSMYYSDKHNCFLFHSQKDGYDYFDPCGNEFIANYSCMNIPNSNNVLVLNNKLYDTQSLLKYNMSIYKWIELGAPLDLLQKFPYMISYSSAYPYSSFSLWDENDIRIIEPIAINQVKNGYNVNYLIHNEQLNTLMDDIHIPLSNPADRLLWKFIHIQDNITMKDIGNDILYPLLNYSKYDWYTYIFTPIMIYIMRLILNMK